MVLRNHWNLFSDFSYKWEALCLLRHFRLMENSQSPTLSSVTRSAPGMVQRRAAVPHYSVSTRDTRDCAEKYFGGNIMKSFSQILHGGCTFPLNSGRSHLLIFHNYSLTFFRSVSTHNIRHVHLNLWANKCPVYEVVQL